MNEGTVRAAAWIVRVKRGPKVGDLFRVDDLYVFEPTDGSKPSSCRWRQGAEGVFALVARVIGRPRDELTFRRDRMDGT